MGTGALCHNCCRTSNQQIAYDRTRGKSPGVEVVLAVIDPVLRPSVPLVQVDSDLSGPTGGYATLP